MSTTTSSISGDFAVLLRRSRRRRARGSPSFLRSSRAQTVEAMSALLEDEDAPSASSSLVPIQPGGSRPPVLLRPCLGQETPWNTGGSCPGPWFRPAPLWACSAGAGREAPSPRPCGRHGGSLHKRDPQAPTGRSLLSRRVVAGGRVAFEMARQIQAVGQRVALLALIDTYHSPPKRTAPDGTSVGAPFRFIGARLRFHYGAVEPPGAESETDLPRQENPERLRLGGFETRSVVRLAARLGARPGLQVVIAANGRASRAYTPKPYDGLVTLFRATDLGITIEDPYLGWRGPRYRHRGHTGSRLPHLDPRRRGDLANSGREVVRSPAPRAGDGDASR